jgi:chemotaxis protein MotB
MPGAEDSRPRIIVRKKKGGHGAHHGGAWKVAYADFVTAMMALFMVLWLLTQADMRLRQQIAQYFREQGILPGGSIVNPEANEAKKRDPGVVARDIMIIQGSAEQERLEGEKRALDEALAKAAKDDPDLAALRDQVIIQVTDAGLSIQVVDKGKDLLFDVSSAELKPALLSLLKQLARQLGHLPNPVQLGGHTDSRPFPPEAGITNWELAFNRANNARKVLETNGLRPGQIHRVISYADSEPLVVEKPLADDNRRLTILDPGGAAGARARAARAGRRAPRRAAAGHAARARRRLTPDGVPIRGRRS